MTAEHNFSPQKIKKNSRRQYLAKGLLAIMMIIGTYVSVFTDTFDTRLFQADLLNLELAPPFDGTTVPVQKVPNWANLTSDERLLSYNKLPESKLIPLPAYSTENLLVATKELKYGSEKYVQLVNEQITYPCPYLCNYQLDGTEESGSHPGVDIKMPLGTPVQAIANGLVTRTKTADSGFGTYVTIGHYKAPEETLYSTYAHLQSFTVKEGDIVKKGDLIGYSGNTGIATTPHLHLQIDILAAPFTPYWPFTAQEARDAGYNFFEAIKNGLGIENARKYTINPMTYIQKYRDFSVTLASDETEISPEVKDTEEVANKQPETATIPEETITDEINDEPTGNQSEESNNESEAQENNQQPDNKNLTTTEPEVTNEQIAQEKEEVIDNFFTFKILADSTYIANFPILISIKTVDQNSEIVTDPKISDSVKISALPESVAVSNPVLSAKDFSKGEAIVRFSAANAGEMVITIHYQNKIITSRPITILEKVAQAASIKIETDKEFVIEQEEPILIKLLDRDGALTPINEDIGELQITVDQGVGVVNPQVLTGENFQNGVAKIFFTGEALAETSIKISGKYNATSEWITPKIFEDIKSDDPHAEALLTLKKRQIFSGYPDGTFRGTQDVARVEALKILLKSSKAELKENTQLNFTDTEAGSWYSSFIATAQMLAIVEGYEDGTFRPASTVSRAEFFKMLFKTHAINVDPIVSEKPYDDVGILQWYAPYAQLAKKMNLIETENNVFEPEKPMNRIEIAEAIYRLLYVMENNELFFRE